MHARGGDGMSCCNAEEGCYAAEHEHSADEEPGKDVVVLVQPDLDLDKVVHFPLFRNGNRVNQIARLDELRQVFLVVVILLDLLVLLFLFLLGWHLAILRAHETIAAKGLVTRTPVEGEGNGGALALLSGSVVYLATAKSRGRSVAAAD